jgi:RNA methyltransferase, TrmH family
MVEKSKVKYIQSLSHKKQRDEEGVFIAEGPKIINELLKEPATEAMEIFALKPWLDGNHFTTHAVVHEIDEIMLSRISLLKTPNQVVGIFKMPSMGKFHPSGNVSLLLQSIQDPGNMGSIIRCADWFGIKQVVCSDDCVDVFNPKVIQSTMGSIARVSIFYEDLHAVINENRTVKIYAAALEGTSIYEMSPVKEGMIIIGNESKGISSDLLQPPVEKITIPRIGNAESLNAAMATGIIVSQLVRSSSIT